MQVRLISKTTGAVGTEYEGRSLDEIVVGKARLSSSRETIELFDKPHKLLRHCLFNGHYSIFDQARLDFEVITSRAIAQQLIRHSSIAVQEYSQRYAQLQEFEPIEIRHQASSNRQSSTDVFNPILWEDPIDYSPMMADEAIASHIGRSLELYERLIEVGVARECARFVLSQSAQSVLHLSGSIRSWITLLNVRLHKTAQKECRLVAEAIRDIFIAECPIISRCLFSFEDAYEIHILDRVVLEHYGVYELVKSCGYDKKSVKLVLEAGNSNHC